MTAPNVFLKEVRDELQKVTWPSRAEIIRLTIVVIIVSLGVGLFIGGVDLALTKALEVLLKV
jgi:preprotein translocase subunit SecE